MQKLRREQGNIGTDRLPTVLIAIDPVIAVPQHLAHGSVLVGQFLQPVEIAANSAPQDGKDKYPPHVHPGSSGRPVRNRTDVPVKQCKQFLLLFRIAPNQLKSQEDRRNVVARTKVNLDAFDRD